MYLKMTKLNYAWMTNYHPPNFNYCGPDITLNTNHICSISKEWLSRRGFFHRLSQHCHYNPWVIHLPDSHNCIQYLYLVLSFSYLLYWPKPKRKLVLQRSTSKRNPHHLNQCRSFIFNIFSCYFCTICK